MTSTDAAVTSASNALLRQIGWKWACLNATFSNVLRRLQATSDRPHTEHSAAGQRGARTRPSFTPEVSPIPGQIPMQVPEENGEGDWGAEEEEDEDLDDEADSSRLDRVRDRRRAKSLPATLFDDIPGDGGRKRVKFADSIGLDLASVKHFSTLEEPQIPFKVLSRLRSFLPRRQQELLEDPRAGLAVDRLVPSFPEPPRGERLEERVRVLRVCLEKVSVTQFDVRGQIRVCTACPGKEVGVRYTFDAWLSHVDAQALPVPVPDDHRHHQQHHLHPSSVGERFAFTMYIPPFLDPGSSVHFAVYLRSEEGEFWDNNGGQNYTLGYHCPLTGTPFAGAAFHAT